MIDPAAEPTETGAIAGQEAWPDPVDVTEVSEILAVDEEPIARPVIRRGRRIHDEGRRRRRLALCVVGLAVLSAVGGVIVGGRLKSPADRAAERRPPRASRITVPVERQRLSSQLTLAGEITYAEPTPIKLAGSVHLAEGETALVTRIPAVDQPVAEGDAVFDVSGRPVFVLQGALPAYRSIGPGASGPDVTQLEEALQRLGFSPGAVDSVYDPATEAALEQFYTAKGYSAVGPSSAEDEQLRLARQAVSDAEDGVRQAEQALEEAGETTQGAELLALQQAVGTARDAVPRAEDTAAQNNQAAAAAVTNATTGRDAARSARDAARTLYDAAAAVGAVNAETGEPYSTEEIAVRQQQLAEAESALATAEQALATAQAEQASVSAQGAADIKAARDARTLAEAQLADATKAPDTSAQQRALDDANEQLWQATADHETADAEIGVRLPAGEVVFVPVLPSTVTAVMATVGGAASDELATVSSSDTQIVGRVSRADSALVTEGARVTVELRDADVTLPGTVTYVGQPQDGGGTGSDDDSGGSDGGSGGGSGRLQVIVTPDDPSLVGQYVFSSVRILVDVAATAGDVLVVPVAAVSVGGDGASRVEVEREPIADDNEGSTEFVAVEVGLTAQGLVEVRPVAGSLHEGDRVVVGVDDQSRSSTASAGATDEGDGGGEEEAIDTEPASDTDDTEPATAGVG